VEVIGYQLSVISYQLSEVPARVRRAGRAPLMADS